MKRKETKRVQALMDDYQLMYITNTDILNKIEYLFEPVIMTLPEKINGNSNLYYYAGDEVEIIQITNSNNSYFGVARIAIRTITEKKANTIAA